MLEHVIKTIKFGHYLLTMLFLEGSLLVRLQSKKHLIPFCKLTFRAILIFLLLHVILCHEQILFEGKRIASRVVSVRSTAWTFEEADKYERTEGGFCPYTTSKGVMRVVVWYEVLHHHSTRDNH
jgi:hypothetical protein